MKCLYEVGISDLRNLMSLETKRGLPFLSSFRSAVRFSGIFKHLVLCEITVGSCPKEE